MGREGTHGVGLVRVSVPVVCLPRISGTAPWGRAGLHSDRGVAGRSFGVLRARCMEQQAQAWHLKGSPLPVPVPAGGLGLEAAWLCPGEVPTECCRRLWPQACPFFGVDRL